MTFKEKIYKTLLCLDENGGSVEPHGYVKGYFKCFHRYGKDMYMQTFKAIRRWDNGGKNRFYKNLALYIVASGQGLKVLRDFEEGYTTIYIH